MAEIRFGIDRDGFGVALITAFVGLAFNHGVAATELASFLHFPVDQASFIYQDIVAKRRATRYLHARPALVEAVAEIPI